MPTRISASGNCNKRSRPCRPDTIKRWPTLNRKHNSVKALMRVDEVVCPYVKGLLKWGRITARMSGWTRSGPSVVYDATLQIYGRAAFDKA